MTQIVYVTIDSQLDPVELTPGQDQPLYWQKICDPAEAVLYGVDLGQFIPLAHPLPAAALPDAWGADDFTRHRIWALAVPTAPGGKQLASYTLGKSGGAPVLNCVWEDIPAAVAPMVISRRQLRRQLLTMSRTDDGAGTRLQQMDEAVAAYAATGTMEALELNEDWGSLSQFHRDHPELLAFCASQGISGDEILSVWTAAALIT